MSIVSQLLLNIKLVRSGGAQSVVPAQAAALGNMLEMEILGPLFQTCQTISPGEHLTSSPEDSDLNHV